jgi:hypothetical protein
MFNEVEDIGATTLSACFLSPLPRGLDSLEDSRVCGMLHRRPLFHDIPDMKVKAAFTTSRIARA